MNRRGFLSALLAAPLAPVVTRLPALPVAQTASRAGKYLAFDAAGMPVLANASLPEGIITLLAETNAVLFDTQWREVDDA